MDGRGREVDGFRVRPGVVRPSTRSFIRPASGRCGCGQQVVLDEVWANACEACGRAYDGDGVELANRSRRVEGTGKIDVIVALGVDLEGHE